ncbi:hypothetical protein N7495_005328 [Penicillium taxi]|uniref:uncharacterized protein n=1 Tax=Penicillium taxi TaxID=168475 RepID=UPI002544F529|nr:uncharacterized protein N7495_005328 [Penicillium taxi]KAJ5893637.1 hypothetical protein N7495_005328 [Penicillium taxi]
MNITTRTQSKLQSCKASSKVSNAKCQKDNSLPPSSNRKKVSDIADTKAKRVRTGCLTCRERHLKCDEALGRCLNCQKSDRLCRRGIRLNFIDIQLHIPPYLPPRPEGAEVLFQDDSRIIASEYVGGFERYPPEQPESPSPIEEMRQLQHEFLNSVGHNQLTSMFHSVNHSFDPSVFDITHSTTAGLLLGSDIWHNPGHVSGDELLLYGTSNFVRKLAMKQYSPSSLTDPEQVLLFQAFVEEVGLWMDAIDTMRHFTQILPFHAIDEPILLQAFLACGARHLSLVNESFETGKPEHYYNAATQDLLSAVHDPDRDSVLCTISAVVLGVYEMMSAQSICKINHIAGSRALIRECGWSAKTPGLGGACFWLSVSMELLSCLQHSWLLSWDPDTWGVDMDMNQHHTHWKGEDVWLHRIIYICAKIANFQVYLQQALSSGEPLSQRTKLDALVHQWNHLNSWCEQWATSIPRSMNPLSYMLPWQTDTKSTFPKIWIIKRPAIVAQLFYHTACILLAKSHPMKSSIYLVMNKIQQTHTYDICGLAANTKDKSVANISIRCIAIAAECIEARESQEEVLGIFDSIAKDTSWHTGPIKEELKHRWGWALQHPETIDPIKMYDDCYELDPALPTLNHHEFPSNNSNPILNMADFSMENHPYQGYYVTPHHALSGYPCDQFLA